MDWMIERLSHLSGGLHFCKPVSLGNSLMNCCLRIFRCRAVSQLAVIDDGTVELALSDGGNIHQIAQK